MATLIKVIPHLNPRIIKILAPITTISVQDLTNQIKDWEDESSNLSYPVLISTSGKESLGGGTSVGITAELQNAQIMFEARTESDAEGTITDSSNSNSILTDDNAVFTYIISPGDSVFNMVTGAVATILSIDSATQITHEPLDDGTVNTWTYGDDYKIWNKIQCEINGGNLVAVDTDGNDISPFLPSAFTHVIRTSASSATLQEQEDIQFSAFEGGIWVDAINGTTGTDFPTGTPRQPSNNLTDALTISSTRGLDKLFIIGDLTFVNSDNVDAKEIIGESQSKTTLTFNAGSSTSGTEFISSTIAGTLVSPSSFTLCDIENVTFDNSGSTIVTKECILTGPITLSSSFTGKIIVLDSNSGDLVTVLDINGALIDDILIRKFAGEWDVRNVTYSYSHIDMDMLSGDITLDSTCTDGIINIRGISNLTDNSNGSTIDTSGLIFANELQLSAFNEKVSVDITNGVSGTQFPIGTRANPVNNITNALTIANSRGIQTLFVIGSITLDTGDNLADFTVEGQNPNQTTVTVNTGADTTNVEYTNCTLIGVLDGNALVRDCTVSDLSFFSGLVLNCMINPGTITLGGGVAANILDCFSGIPGLGSPIINMGGSGQSLGLRGYNGGMRLQNKTGTDSVSIDMNSGQIVLDSDVTNGNIVIRGVSTLTDNSTGSASINTSGLIFADQTQLASFSEKVTCDVVSGSSGTKFPIGTAQFPTNNLDDTLSIAVSRGITTISIVGNLTVNYAQDVSGYRLVGHGIFSSTVTLNVGATTVGSIFEKCQLTGTCGGAIVIPVFCIVLQCYLLQPKNYC